MEADIKRLYELIGRLFAEGRDMQALIHQLQSSLNDAQQTLEKQKEEIFFANQEAQRFKGESALLARKLKVATDGQEQA